MARIKRSGMATNVAAVAGISSAASKRSADVWRDVVTDVVVNAGTRRE